MEGKDKYSLEVIIGPKAYRNAQEIELFQGVFHFSVTFVSFSKEIAERYNLWKIDPSLFF